jgi:hypothetical protein
MSTLIATANLRPIKDFTPEKNSPTFSGLTNEVINIAAYTGITVTLLPSDVMGGFITANNAGAQMFTLPSAAALIPLIEGARVGSSIIFILKELAAGTVTLAAGTGGTIVGTPTVATANIKQFLLQVTAIGPTPTYSCYSLGTAAF